MQAAAAVVVVDNDADDEGNENQHDAIDDADFAAAIASHCRLELNCQPISVTKRKRSLQNYKKCLLNMYDKMCAETHNFTNIHTYTYIKKIILYLTRHG